MLENATWTSPQLPKGTCLQCEYTRATINERGYGCAIVDDFGDFSEARHLWDEHHFGDWTRKELKKRGINPRFHHLYARASFEDLDRGLIDCGHRHMKHWPEPWNREYSTCQLCFAKCEHAEPEHVPNPELFTLVQDVRAGELILEGERELARITTHGEVRALQFSPTERVLYTPAALRKFADLVGGTDAPPAGINSWGDEVHIFTDDRQEPIGEYLVPGDALDWMYAPHPFLSVGFTAPTLHALADDLGKFPRD